MGCVRGRGDEINVCDMEEFGRLWNSEKTISILGDRWWPQTAKQSGDTISKQCLSSIWKNRNERPNVGGVSIRSRNGAPFRMGCVVNGQMTQASNKCVHPPYMLSHPLISHLRCHRTSCPCSLYARPRSHDGDKLLGIRVGALNAAIKGFKSSCSPIGRRTRRNKISHTPPLRPPSPVPYPLLCRRRPLLVEPLSPIFSPSESSETPLWRWGRSDVAWFSRAWGFTPRAGAPRGVRS